MKRIHSTRASVIALVSCVTLVAIIAGYATRTASGNRKKSDGAATQAITLRAVANDNPYIKLSDGRELSSSESSDMSAASADNPKPGDKPSELQPLSLASADFDEDGVPDLIGAFAATPNSVMKLYRGNQNHQGAIDDEARRAKEELPTSPFLSGASIFDLSDKPDFIGAGDFDADGHTDIAFASREGNSLRLMSGDGRGGFHRTKEITLPGRVTAMAVGDINRRDGLADIVVGVVTADGSKALVLESADGAIHAVPETISLANEATAIAIGQFDNDPAIDFAVAAGSEIVLAHGRDKQLALSDEARAQVKSVKLDRYSTSFSITAMTAGDFKGDSREELALASNDGSVHMFERTDKRSSIASNLARWQLSNTSAAFSGSQSSHPLLIATRLSSLSKSDLLLGDQANHRLNVVACDTTSTDPVNPQAAATASSETSLESSDEVVSVLRMRLNQDARDGLVILKKGESHIATVTSLTAMTFTVSNTNDLGAGSLRQAIIDSNNNAGTDTIVFNIGAGTPAINLSSPLPALTQPATINGATGGATRVVINGANAGANANGLYILAGGCSINGLVIENFSANGILIQTGGGNVIANCFVGIDATGSFAAPNSTGIFVLNSANNLIGGTTPGVTNVVSGNNIDGIRLDSSASTGNTIQSNYIGTNLGGTANVGNGFNGVVILAASNNNVGGSVAGSRNIISGNFKNGVGMNVSGVVNATGNLVQRNYIGTNLGGTEDIGNFQNGVLLVNVSGNTIGGATSGARNLISGNREHGVMIMNVTATGNQVLGNYIGTNFDGSTALANDLDGVNVEDAPSNSIGGSAAGAGNVISANGHGGLSGASGVTIEGSSATGNTIQGNIIGLTATGAAKLGNTAHGVSIVDASNTTIGGTSVGARNVISGNKNTDIFSNALSAGIYISGSASGCVIQGNYIGTDSTGTVALGNSYWGIRIREDVVNTTIGGSTSTARNVISGNGGSGIDLGDSVTTSTGTVIRGNYIGTTASGTADLGNGSEGIFIDGSPGNTIGGTTGTTPGGGCTGDCNLISGNGNDGIYIINGQASANVIQGNYIGTNAAGTAAIKNDKTGIHLWNINSTVVGGTTAAARNIISGNGEHGIWKDTRFNSGDTIQGNYVGVATNGTSTLGNFGHGILIENAANSTIGGTAAGAGNTIGFNGGDGVAVLFGRDSYGTGNKILSNSIFSNVGLGIDLENNSVTANDSGDGDGGANNLQNFPVLTAANNTGSGTDITGSLNSTASTAFTIQFFSSPTCDASGSGEGQFFFGSTSTATNASGNSTFSVTLSVVPVGFSVTATATDPNGNTSEFSACRAVTACTYSISPMNQSFAAAGGTGSVNVTAGSGCGWSATSNATWITITSGGSGTGNGTLNYSVGANSTPARTGTMTIAGQTFTVNQSTGCSFSISPLNQSFAAAGGTGSVNVTAGSGCTWSSMSNATWITITSGGSGTGNGTLNYSVAANTTPARTGTMTIAGQTFTVNESGGCAFSISPLSRNHSVAAETGSVTVTAGAGCSWTATESLTWVTITSGSSGTGSGTTNYSVASNTGPARSGTISVAGQTFTINQAGSCAFTLGSSSQSFAATALTGNTVSVTTQAGCAWTATVNPGSSFITITSGATGTGNGTVTYSVAANSASSIRNGTMTIAGQTFTVYQGIQFADVPVGTQFYTEIGKLSARGVTLGCGGGNYCPDQPVVREQMAAFMIRALGNFNPPTPPTQRFSDVPPSNPFYAFIDQMAVLQITVGCGGGNYCPTQPVLRQEMAAFLIRALGNFDPPTPPSQRFNDVPPSNPFYKFIDQMAVLGITNGCSTSAPMYCPFDTVTRAQMAAFLVRAFNL